MAALQRHPFEFYAVVDVEATCIADRSAPWNHEIIEWPCVLLDVATLTVHSEFQAYVRPESNPVLSDFCTKLTGITQRQVDSGHSLSATLANFDAWLRDQNMFTKDGRPRFCFLTDGPWDLQHFLHEECQRKEIEKAPYYDKWVNVRWLFAQHLHVKRRNVTKMLEHFGLTFEGREHSGLDDARNIARIAVHLARDGCVLNPNDGLGEESVGWVLGGRKQAKQIKKPKRQALPTDPEQARIFLETEVHSLQDGHSHLDQRAVDNANRAVQARRGAQVASTES